MNFLKTPEDHFVKATNFIKASYKPLTNVLQTFHKRRTNFQQISYKLLMNVLQTSNERLTNF